MVPWINVQSGESPFTLALTTMQFKWASLAMSAIILTAVLSCLNSAFYVCSRVLFVLAEHGDAPQWLVQLNARRVPTRSVWMGSLAGVLGIFAATTSLADGVRLPGERVRRADGVHLHDDRGGAPARAPRARGERGAGAGGSRCGCFPGRTISRSAGMAAVLVAMALTPDMQRDFRASVLSLAVALAAFLIVNARRKARAATRRGAGIVRRACRVRR